MYTPYKPTVAVNLEDLRIPERMKERIKAIYPVSSLNGTDLYVRFHVNPQRDSNDDIRLAIRDELCQCAFTGRKEEYFLLKVT